jgi:hypothetical protein
MVQALVSSSFPAAADTTCFPAPSAWAWTARGGPAVRATQRARRSPRPAPHAPRARARTQARPGRPSPPPTGPRGPCRSGSAHTWGSASSRSAWRARRATETVPGLRDGWMDGPCVYGRGSARECASWGGGWGGGRFRNECKHSLSDKRNRTGPRRMHSIRVERRACRWAEAPLLSA